MKKYNVTLINDSTLQSFGISTSSGVYYVVTADSFKFDAKNCIATFFDDKEKEVALIVNVATISLENAIHIPTPQ